MRLLSLLLLTLFIGETASFAGDLKIQSQLVWGTNDEKSPNPDHKVVDAKLARKLEKSPYKWRNYFEVHKQSVALPRNGSKSIQMSEKCKLDVKNLGHNKVEVKLYGADKLVSQTTQNLPVGETLILSGDAKNDTAWLVILTSEP